MKLSEIKEILKNTPNIKYDYYNNDERDLGIGEINRIILFESRGIEFEIQWWINQSYLYIGGVGPILFKKVEKIHTWPNHAKMNLQFYQNESLPCCIIEVDWYEEIKK